MVMPSVDKQGIEFDCNETQVAPENAFGFKPAMTDDLTVDDMVNTFVGGEAQVAPEDDFEAQAALAEDLAMSEMVSTFVGNEVVAAPAKEPEPESFGDFALDMDLAESSATVVNPDILRMAMGDNDEPVPSAVEVKAAPAPVVDDDESLDFDVRLTDSSVLGQPMHVPSYDIGSINLDLSSDEPAPAAASMASDFAQPAAIDVEPAAPSAPEFSAAQREEVSTKLDLAKAYEEMGDLEGARELLQEVSLEGPPDLVEQAREILGRIGE
jgi:pilus assembly protein FimV